MVGAGGRRDVTNDPFDSLLYMSPSGVPKSTETHAGDDVSKLTIKCSGFK